MGIDTVCLQFFIFEVFDVTESLLGPGGRGLYFNFESNFCPAPKGFLNILLKL